MAATSLRRCTKGSVIVINSPLNLDQLETLVVVVETAETTLLGVVTTATAAGVLGVRPAQPAMTAEYRRHPIPGMTVVVTTVQLHAVDLVVANPGSAGTKRRWLPDELRRHLRCRMLYRHACPLGPRTGSRRSSGTTAAAGVGTGCHPHPCGRSWSLFL